ncbi:unnamed protein product [Parajaminaea phylloscopi]
MGQAATKQSHHHSHNPHQGSHANDASTSRATHAGTAPSYPASVDGGALEPQGVYTGPQDYSHDVVKTAIVQRKLMPFYKGVDDEDTYAASHQHVSECPICFLYYPSTLNRTRCCGQPVCTECFVQIKRADPNHTNPPSSQPAECPFCTADNFGVVYTRTIVSPPAAASDSQAGPSSPHAASDDGTPPPSVPKAKRKSFSHSDPEVLTTDMVRPDWQARLATAQAAILRRANRRIIMRQVGDRLVPIGVSSSRVGAELPEGNGPGGAIILREGERWGSFSGSEEAAGSTSNRRGSRRGQAANYMQMAGQEVEDMMIMEAMRLSLIEHEEQQRKQASSSQQGTQSRSGSDAQESQSQGESALSTSPRAQGASRTDDSAGLARRGSGLGRSSSTSRGQPMSAPTPRAQRISKELRATTGPSGELSTSPLTTGAQPSTSLPGGSSPSPATLPSPPQLAAPINFGLRDDVMSELAELIEEPNEDMRQRIESARRAREEQSRRAEAAEHTAHASDAKAAVLPTSVTDLQSTASPVARLSTDGSPRASAPSSPSSRPLNPNNPFRARMASSGAAPAQSGR